MHNTCLESFKAFKLKQLTNYILDLFDDFIEERKEDELEIKGLNDQDVEKICEFEKIRIIRSTCFDDRKLQDPYSKNYDQQIEIIKVWLMRYNYPIEHREYKIRELFNIDLDDYLYLSAVVIQDGALACFD